MTLGAEPIEEVFIVLDKTGKVYAVFTTEEDARKCIKKYSRRSVERHDLWHHFEVYQAVTQIIKKGE